jgi:hypothetical protein
VYYTAVEIITTGTTPTVLVCCSWRWYEQFRCSNLLVLVTIGYQWSDKWHEHRNSAQHCPLLVESKRSASCCWMIWRDATMKQLCPKHMHFIWRKQLYHCQVCAQHLCNGERQLLISSCRKHMCFLWWRELIKGRCSGCATLSPCRQYWRGGAINDDMNSADAWLALAQNTYVFYGGQK